MDIVLPQTNKIIDSITFDDLGIEPDFIIDNSDDPINYNEEGNPIRRLYELKYNVTKHIALNEYKEKAKKEYDEWLSKAPWFIHIIKK